MPNPLNILIDARPLVDPNAGGVGRVALQTLTALVHATEDATFAFVTTGTRRPSLPDVFASRPNVTHVHMALPNKLWSALCLLGLTSLDREVSRRTKEAYHAALLPNLGFTGRLAIPYALILHDLSFIIEPRWFPWKMRLWHRAVRAKDQIRRAARLFCVSETTARDAECLLNISSDRIEVFYPGMPFDPIGAQPRPQSLRDSVAGGRAVPLRELKKPFVLALGESNPRKNVSTAIAAVARLREDPAFADLRLIIIGSTPTAERRRPNADWITRLPHVTDPDLADLYQHAVALLYPSWYEGFGLPLHEAARFGTPCLASAHGALPETAPEGTLFIPPAKPHLWASALRDVLSHPELYRTIFDATRDEPRINGILQWIRM